MKKMFLKAIMLQTFVANDYLTNYGVSLEIDITPGEAETFTVLGDGFDNLAESLNEVVNQYFFLNKNGYGESEVTGMQPMMTLTGVRMRQDAAQNFIFGKKYELLEERKTNFRLAFVNAAGETETATWNNVTLANLQEFSGATTDGTAISVEIHSSEKPVITTV